MSGSLPLAGQEPAGVDAQAVSEAQHELGGEVDTSLASLDPRDLASGDSSSALELALAPPELEALPLHAGDDALGDGGHRDSVATKDQDAQGERWFIIAGDVDAAEYSGLLHDGEGWR